MLRKGLVALLSVLAMLLLCETSFRLLDARFGVDQGLIERARHFYLTGFMPGYEERAHTVFQHKRSQQQTNSYGYKDFEWSLEKTPGVPRILCLGGSTTEGSSDGGIPSSYPLLLADFLERETGRDFEVLNAGMSGWCTAEILIAWFLLLQDFAPDLVLIHEGVNDLAPRFFTGFRADYSHWRKPVELPHPGALERLLLTWSDLFVFLRLGGEVPNITSLSTRDGQRLAKLDPLPPETALPFLRNLRSIAESARAQGAAVVLVTMPMKPDQAPGGPQWRSGLKEHNRLLRELAAERGYGLADVESAFAQRPELGAEFADLVHLSTRGNQAKAEAIGAVLLRDWVPGLSKEGARPPVQSGRHGRKSANAGGNPPEPGPEIR